MSGGGTDDLVRVACVDVEGDVALVAVDASSIHDVLENGTLRVRDLLVVNLQAADLRMITKPQNVANGSKVFRPTVGAGEHYDRADPGKLPAMALMQHPDEEPLQYEAALAMGDDGDVTLFGERDLIPGSQSLCNIVVVWDARRGEGQLRLLR